MEILRVSTRADPEEPEGWAIGFILLRLLLDSEEGSQMARTVGAFESNLLLSRTHRASADAKFAVKLTGHDYS